MSDFFSHWPNTNSRRSLVTLTSIIACKVLKVPMQWTLLLNVPIRLFNIREEVKSENYYRTALEVAALSALFAPRGMSVAIGLDCFSELLNIYSIFKKIGKLDDTDAPMTREEALKLFNFSEDTRDLNAIETQYNKILTAMEFRKTRLPPGYFLETTEALIKKVKKAREILISEG
jgi:hypothetical protein